MVLLLRARTCPDPAQDLPSLAHTTPPHIPRPQRLATGEWFTSRVSSAGLFATGYPRAPAAAKAELRHLYAALAKDETPMVRRAAAHRLGGFAKAVEREHVGKELMHLFTDLIQDGAPGGTDGGRGAPQS